MRHLTRPIVPVLMLFLASVSVAHAQTGPGGGGTGFGGGGSNSGGGSSSGGVSSGSSGGLGFGGGGLGGGTGSGSTTGGRAGTSGTAAALSQSNFLASSYVNVYANGLYTDSTMSSGSTSEGNVKVGGSGTSNSPKLAATFFKTTTFGQPLYNISTSGRAGGGSATIRSGTTGNRSTGSATINGQGDIGPVISGVRAPFVSTTIKFATTPISADTMTRDLRDLVQRSTTLTSKNNINIQVQDRFVRLTGTVATEDERRHIAQLIQLSQSVRGVINDLEVK
jgi:hypothetical protein